MARLEAINHTTPHHILFVKHLRYKNDDATKLNTTSGYLNILVCLGAWPLNESEAGVDLVLIETSLFLLC